MMLTYILLLATVVHTALAMDPVLKREILYAQDQRDGVILSRFFSHHAAEVRSAAIMSAGSVQDTSHIAPLIGTLNDPDQGVRVASAFALGQMTQVVTISQRRVISGSLLELLVYGADQHVIAAATQALGKCGDESSLPSLVSLAQSMQEEAARANIALAIGRYASRGIRDVRATALAAELLEETENIPWQAAYAMMRIGADSLLRPFVPVMEQGLMGASPDVRIYLASALGSAGDEHAVPLLIDAASTDADWRVRVNATRALGVLNTEQSREAILRLAGDQNEHVSLTALSALAGTGSTGAEVQGTVQNMLHDPSLSMRQRGSAAVTLASLFRDRVAGDLQAAFERGLVQESDFIRSLGMMDGDAAFEKLLALVRSDDPISQRFALDALNVSTNKMDRRTELEQALWHGVRSDDMAVMTTAAAALEDSNFHSPATAQVIIQRLAELKLPDDVEPMTAMIQTLGSIRYAGSQPVLKTLLDADDRTVAVEAARALEAIDGASYLTRVPARGRIEHTDYDWLYLECLQQARVVVETKAGQFAFELLPDEAPFTCVNAARLIEKGFYDGLLFHRVVPNFVVQGGDPRGDGWGGPGYSIRSEFGTMGYERGMVGVASAGKDTEGCQFFVTHSKQPHLDGRYTIFGHVTAGMDVVDQIQVGDRILKMRVEWK